MSKRRTPHAVTLGACTFPAADRVRVCPGDEHPLFSVGEGAEQDLHHNPSVIAAMAECGIDITSEYPSHGPTRSCGLATRSAWGGDACPLFPGKRYEDWNDLGDPAGLDLEGVRPIRDEIERRVHHLLADLQLAPTAEVAAVGTQRTSK